MSSRKRLTSPLFWVSCVLLLLYAALSHANSPPTVVLPEALGGTERYLAYVSTDKPIYRQNEKVFIRAVILNAADNTPSTAGNQSIMVKISGPKGDVVHEGTSYGEDSAIGYQWDVPAGISGGQYTAKVTSPTLGFPETARVFDIRTFRAPRMKTQVQFTRDGYGPGDLVRASVSIERAEGGVPTDASVMAIARLDGKEVYRSANLPISTTGVVDTDFNLPADISVGDGSLSFVIEDGGVVETASKSLPILLQKLDIEFYPESGELVAGLQSRVYFQALLSNGKPADIEGHIVELDGDSPGTKVIAEFKSEHEGRGLFSITPEKGKQYTAVFTAPKGITHPAPLPTVSKSGTVIKSQQDAFAFDDHIEFSVASNANKKPIRLTLHKREVLLDSQTVNSETVQLDGKDAEGVLIATVWDKSGHPLAERLIYRHPRFGLNVELKLSDGPFLPGATAVVDVLTTDDNGNPVEAVVGLTVTDDTVLELIDKREQAPRLPAMVYLENDVLDLADAHVYLDKSDETAATAIDLLLGTQGWRRFVLVDYDDITQQFPSKIAQAMAKNIRIDLRLRRVEKGLVLQMFRDAENADVQMVAAEAPEEAEQPQVDADVVDADVVDAVGQADLGNVRNNELQPEEKRKRVKDDIFGQGIRLAEMELAGDVAMARPANKGYVREFAYQANPNRSPNERTDFTETLYWNSGVKTSARDGRATIEFSLSDSVTTFRVLADGFGRNGALGSGDAVIASVEPFYITAKMPVNAIAGDVIELPVTLVNTTDKAIENASFSVNGNGITKTATKPMLLAPGQRLRSIVTVKTNQVGSFPITINAQAGSYTDSVTRQLTIAPKGFPVAHNAGGVLSSSEPFTTTLTIPNNIAAGSLSTTAKVYPSPLASMQEALNALLREPHGCFEQTSSTNYPLVMAQQYFDSHTGIDPALIAKSQGLLKAGYSKLIGFESEDSGYEWFGANPAHEALTAYGLMEFTDMAKVMQIDNTMIERTRQWLLDRRDGKGSFKRNERAIDSFGRAPAPTTDAYIVWALLESGQNPQTMTTEIAQVKDSAFMGNDSYVIALAANILYLSGDNASADLLAEKLIKASSDEGGVNAALTSITGSGGDALSIETTSLALLAWLRDDDQWAAQVEKSIKWLFERSKAGRFGSTQSTVLALKAINTYDAARAVPKQPGSVQLFINGELVGEPVEFTTETKGAIELPDFSNLVKPGKYDIELRMTEGSKMPFALDITYNTPLPVSGDTRPVRLVTAMSHTSITEGEPLELKVSVSALDANVPTPIAIIGIPAGLEVRHDQLKELVGEGSISAYEVRESELVLYWRAFKANEKRTIPIGLTAEIPGNYTGTASRIYPYYTDEQKHWEAGHLIEVVAR